MSKILAARRLRARVRGASGAALYQPKPLLLALGLVALPLGAAAQDAEPTRLQEMVVTASGFEQELKDAPASISVITREELQTRHYRDLAEALQNVEGIDVRGATGKTGGLNISIRGMPSDYTLILIDGRRQNVAGDVTPNGFGDALTSFMPPISAIERIEVIRGPMSTLYGSDAMGGVVNIITRKVAKQWGGSIGLEAGVPEDKDWGSTQKINFFATGPLKEDLLGLQLRGSFFHRGESELISAPDGTTAARNPAPVESRQHSLGARLTLTPTKAHDLWLDVEQNRTWYNNDECQLGNVDYQCGNNLANANGYRDYLRFNRDQYAIGHTSRLGFGVLESSLMRSVTETLGRTIPTDARPGGNAHPDVGKARKLETTNTVFDTKLVAPLGERHVATVGGQWWDAKLEDGLLPENHSQTIWSVFAEDEWRILNNLALTVGARYDHHDAFGGEVSPRAYLVWNASDNWTVKGGVAKGFRAPRLNQLIDGISGISGQGTNITIGNPDLKPETSTNTELGVLYDDRRGFNASVTAFHNKIKDKIASGGDCTVNWISGCAANPTATYSINNDEAKTWGVEFATRIRLAKAWTLNLNYTWTDSELITDGRKNGKLSDTAEHVANAQLRWDATEKLALWVRGEYRGESRRFDGDPKNLTGNNRLEYEALGDLKAYTLFHLGGSYKVSKDVTLSANIFNLFDKDFTKFKQWTNTNGDTVWGSEYFRSRQSIKGFVPTGRMFWIAANINF